MENAEIMQGGEHHRLAPLLPARHSKAMPEEGSSPEEPRLKGRSQRPSSLVCGRVSANRPKAGLARLNCGMKFDFEKLFISTDFVLICPERFLHANLVI